MNALHGLSAIAAEMPQLQQQQSTPQTTSASKLLRHSSLPLRKRPCNIDITRPKVTIPPPPVPVSREKVALLDECNLLQYELARRRSIAIAGLSSAAAAPSVVQHHSHSIYATTATPSQVPSSNNNNNNNRYHQHQPLSFLLNPQVSNPVRNIDSRPMFVGSAAVTAAGPSVQLFAQAQARAASAAQHYARSWLGASQREQQQRLLQDKIYQNLMMNHHQQPQPPVQQTVATAVPGLQEVLPNGLTVEDMMAVLEYSKAKQSTTESSATARPAQEILAKANKAQSEVQESAGIGTLSLPNDSTFLSESHCFLRSVCLELFVSTELHVRTPGKGARPARLGQVGIRCVHCKDVPRSQQANQAICYPSKRDRIYESVRNFQRVHFMACKYTPDQVKLQFKAIVKRGAGPKRSQRLVRAYYAQAASEVGLIDSPSHGGGLEYRRENSRVVNVAGGDGRRNVPSEEMMTILRAAKAEEELAASGHGSVGRGASSLSSSTSSYLLEGSLSRASATTSLDENVKYGKFDTVASDDTRQVLRLCQETGTPFVQPQDFDTISDFVYLLFHQLLPCKHTPATIKRRRLNPDQVHRVPGLCCKHCHMADGINGMYFPLSVDSLGDSSFSQTLMMHIVSCSHAPQEIKNALEELKALAKEYNSSVKRGAKKVFMEKVWRRMEDIGTG